MKCHRFTSKTCARNQIHICTFSSHDNNAVNRYWNIEFNFFLPGNRNTWCSIKLIYESQNIVLFGVNWIVLSITPSNGCDWQRWITSQLHLGHKIDLTFLHIEINFTLMWWGGVMRCVYETDQPAQATKHFQICEAFMTAGIWNILADFVLSTSAFSCI